MESEHNFSTTIRPYPPRVSSVFKDSIMPDHSQRYFTRELSEHGNGIKGLIRGAFQRFHNTNLGASLEECKFHLMLLSLLHNMTGAQKSTLMDLFRHLKTNPTPNGNQQNAKTPSVLVAAEEQ